MLNKNHTPQGKTFSGWSGDYVTPSKTAPSYTPSADKEQQEQHNNSNIQNNATCDCIYYTKN
eukprot:15355402-Ditylum_brightwellii.AAC.1